MQPYYLRINSKVPKKLAVACSCKSKKAYLVHIKYPESHKSLNSKRQQIKTRKHWNLANFGLSPGSIPNLKSEEETLLQI